MKEPCKLIREVKPKEKFLRKHESMLTTTKGFGNIN